MPRLPSIEPQPVGDPMPPFPAREMSAADLHEFLFREPNPWSCSASSAGRQIKALMPASSHIAVLRPERQVKIHPSGEFDQPIK